MATGRKLFGCAGDCQNQVDPEVGAWLCVAWHIEVKELNAILSAHVGVAVSLLAGSCLVGGGAVIDM